MLPKRNRVNQKTIIQIFKSGKFLSSENLTFKFIKIPQNKASGETKISFIVPKNTTKLAVKRNQLRHLGYSALKKYFKALPSGIQGVFLFKKEQTNLSQIENEIEKIFNKID